MWHKIDKNGTSGKIIWKKKKLENFKKENRKPMYLDSSAQKSDRPSYFKKT